MGNKRFFYEKERSLIEQKAALKIAYPESYCSVEKNGLWWIGKIRPTPLSQTYTVVLIYQRGEAPQIWVLGDELKKLSDENFPHNYHVDSSNKLVRICLYRHQEFSKRKILANTIIPWTIEWLYFYEIWLATGEWCGGGEHPVVAGEDTSSLVLDIHQKWKDQNET